MKAMHLIALRTAFGAAARPTTIGLAVAAAALLLGSAACGDNLKQTPDDAPVTDDAPIDAPQQPASGPCLDRPTDLPRPPTGALDCDLLPPGFVAETP